MWWTFLKNDYNNTEKLTKYVTTLFNSNYFVYYLCSEVEFQPHDDDSASYPFLIPFLRWSVIGHLHIAQIKFPTTGLGAITETAGDSGRSWPCNGTFSFMPFYDWFFTCSLLRSKGHFKLYSSSWFPLYGCVNSVNWHVCKLLNYGLYFALYLWINLLNNAFIDWIRLTNLHFVWCYYVVFYGRIALLT